MTVGEIRTLFTGRFREQGYLLVPGFPLTATDGKALLFVNASVTPFLMSMIEGQILPRTAIVQPCFRANAGGEWLFAFEMLGLVAMGEELEAVTDNTITFLHSLDSLASGSIHFVLDSADRELTLAVRPWATSNNFHTLEGNSEKYWTRWQFGFGDRLIGRGMTVVWENTRLDPCSAECGIHCKCARWFPLGNIILLTGKRSSHRYVDVGFGVECLAGAPVGDLFSVNTLASIVDGLVQLPPNITTNCRELANLLHGIATLIGAGVRPSNKGRGYVLRMLIRRLTDEVAGAYETDDISDRVKMVVRTYSEKAYQNTSLLEESRIVIEEEVAAYLDAIRLGVAKVKSFLRRRSLSPEASLGVVRDTFGLPRAIARRLIERMGQTER